MEMHGTTILAVRRGENVVIAADGQVTLGNTVLKHSATKLRKLYDSNIIAGFAGATADAFTLFERFEIKLKDFSGTSSARSSSSQKSGEQTVSLGNSKRCSSLLTDNILISLPGMAMFSSQSMVLLRLARVETLPLLRLAHWSTKPICRPEKIAEEAMAIAADLCIYTNDKTIYAELES